MTDQYISSQEMNIYRELITTRKGGHITKQTTLNRPPIGSWNKCGEAAAQIKIHQEQGICCSALQRQKAVYAHL